MVSTLFALRLKAPSSAGATADADTVTTVSEPAALSSRAVTSVALSVPLSAMVDDPSSSVTTGLAAIVADGGQASLVRDSALPASSLKLTLTLTFLPTSAAASV